MAVTETITTQWPPPPHVPALGLTMVVQAAVVIVPPLSHPQETEEVMLLRVRFELSFGLSLKSFWTAAVMPAVSTDCGKL